MATDRTPAAAWKNRLIGLGFALAFLPFAAMFVAVMVDVTAWFFTGHELFPWIGKAFNG